MRRAAGNRPMAILIEGPLPGYAAYPPARVHPRGEEAQPFFDDHWVVCQHSALGTLSPGRTLSSPVLVADRLWEGE